MTAKKRTKASQARRTAARKTPARKAAAGTTSARKPVARKGPALRRAKTSGHKPRGYTTVSPYLIVAGAKGVIDFLKEAFGATDLRRYDMPDGTIMHAEVRIDDTVVMVGDSGPQWPPYSSHLHVYLPDVDAAYRRALAAGGVAVQEPVRKQGDPDKRGGVKDPAGNTWWISTQIE